METGPCTFKIIPLPQTIKDFNFSQQICDILNDIPHV